jgi:hypothetical protein
VGEKTRQPESTFLISCLPLDKCTAPAGETQSLPEATLFSGSPFHSRAVPVGEKQRPPERHILDFRRAS